MRTLVWGAATVGAIIGGLLADAAGVRAPFVLAACCYLAGGVIGYRPLRRVLAHPPVHAEATETV
jgi:hypothetical protein